MLLSMNVLAQEPTADEIDALAQRAMDAFHTPGIAISVVKDGELVYAEGHGVREIGRPEPVDAEKIFQIASLTKAFTAVSPDTDFSYDFHDLDLRRVGED
jgi:CubicO group peptidase (beta-lactamase class C family)